MPSRKAELADPAAIHFAQERLGPNATVFKLLEVGARFKFSAHSPVVMVKRSQTGWYEDPTHPRKGGCFRTGPLTGVLPWDDGL